MNYFAHGLRFLDRPWFLAGTAVPDWLSVADRRVKLRERSVAPHAEHGEQQDCELASGVLQHLADDRWFHRTAAFYEVTGRMAALFRESLEGANGHRPSFLGHVATEMLIDSVLIGRDPPTLDRYYTALDAVDPRRIEACVNRMARGTTERLAWFIDAFRQSRFLAEYRAPPRLLYRLNQVLHRVRLDPLPDRAEAALVAGRELIESRLKELLPPDRFELPLTS